MYEANRHRFAIIIIILEVAITILYGIFVRVKPHADVDTNQSYYPMYQDVNVMMLIGFGFLMTYIKKHSWSALVYTFFINAIVVQLYILLSNFWLKVFHGHWEEKIYVEEKEFTAASYSVAAILIAFGGVLGKVGPLELIVMALIGIVGYTLNEKLVYEVLHTIDAGGSTAIHVFGAYFGLSVSFVICKKYKPLNAVETTYGNIIFAMIGTLFLWMFWPSFNAGYFPESEFHRSLIISNTIVSLTGSCLSTFATSSLLRKKFNMEDIINATLAGGVAIGACSGVVANMGVSLTIGIIAGFLSNISYAKLLERLEHGFLGIHDTCGIHNLHGIPGLMGGFTSAMVIASYQTWPGFDSDYASYMHVVAAERTYSQQAGIQVGATFMSMGIGIAFGLLAGAVIYPFYHQETQDFFDDNHYFELPHE